MWLQRWLMCPPYNAIASSTLLGRDADRIVQPCQQVCCWMSFGLVATFGSHLPYGSTTTGPSGTASSGATTPPSPSDGTVAYVRVSTTSEEQETSIRRQLAYVSSRAELVLQEQASGTSTDRPEYRRLLHLITTGQVQRVLAARDDRLNRGAAEMQHLFHLCQLHGVELELFEDSVWQGLAEADPLAREELLRERSLASERESRTISTRLRRHYLTAEQRGLTLIRKAPLAYRVVDGQLQPDHRPVGRDARGDLVSEWQCGEKLLQLVMAHQTIRGARNAFRDWLLELEPVNEKRHSQLLTFSATAVGDWLRDPTVRGARKGRVHERRYNPDTRKIEHHRTDAVELIWGQHPALISHEQFDLLEAMRQRNQIRSFARTTTEEWIPLHTILRCQGCGSRFNITRSGKGHRTYYCSKRHRGGSKDCPNAGINHHQLKQLLAGTLPALAFELADLEGGRKPQGGAGKTAQLEARLKRYQLALADDPGDEGLQQLIVKVEGELSRLHAEAAAAQERSGHVLNRLLSMGSRQYWEEQLQDPGAGHRQVLELVEWMTVWNRDVDEVKLVGIEKPYWLGENA